MKTDRRRRVAIHLDGLRESWRRFPAFRVNRYQEISMKRYRSVLLTLAAIAVFGVPTLSPATPTTNNVIDTPSEDWSARRPVEFARMTKDAAESANRDAMNGYSSAALWYRRAAGHGSVTAMYNLALMSEEGLGVDWSQSAAQRYYSAAAEAGYVPAMLALGERYVRGQGVKRDLVLGYAWIAVASWFGQADRNTEQARHWLARLRVTLPDEKLSRARLLSAHLATLIELRAVTSPMVEKSAVLGGGS
jgi:Sel1 repeat